jgi:hypothetical protein
VQHFRTFCVVYNSSTNTAFSLREATWDINLDSASASPQHATVNPDAAASADPALGIQSNNAPLTTVNNAFGAATTNFTK